MKSLSLPLWCFASAVTASCLHATSFSPRIINRDGTVQISNFGYTGSRGPLRWHNLTAENALCKTGRNQSPINIDASINNVTEHPTFTIPDTKSTEFENLGTTVEVIMSNGTTFFAGKTYALNQFHFHTPSEHRVNEEFFPMEMHMVHTANDSSVLVLGVLFDVSSTGEGGSACTSLLNTLARSLPAISLLGSVVETSSLNFTSLVSFLSRTPLRQYSGSLTTPPCKEGVTFLIASRPLQVEPATFNAFKRVIKFNSRYTQNKLGEVNLLENL